MQSLPLECQEFYQKSIVVEGPEKVKKMCLATIGQSSNPTWLLERKNRVTASKAHKIWRARKPETILRYFFEAPIFHVNLAYGVALESEARSKYEEITKNQAQEVGLVVRPDFPFLGASPDGIVIENDVVVVLEIKCPKSCEDASIDIGYIEADGSLKQSHMYYTQVQLQLFCVNADICHFFVYSRSDHKLIVVERDDDFI